MNQKITLDRDVVTRLIEGSKHLYTPAFPDKERRQEISMAVAEAEEEVLEE